MKKILLYLPLFIISVVLTGCFTEKDEPLIYNNETEFYGAWQVEFTNNPNRGYDEYLRIYPGGYMQFLRVYKPEYYPKGMFDLLDKKWALDGNYFIWDIMRYKIEYMTRNEIYLNNGNIKLRKVSEQVFDLYTSGNEDPGDKTIDEDGEVLNYSSPKDFVGTWKVTYLEGTFGIRDYEECTLYIYEDGTLKSVIYNTYTNITTENVTTWSLKKNVFYWGIVNYDINYVKSDRISLSRSATNMLLTRQ